MAANELDNMFMVAFREDLEHISAILPEGVEGDTPEEKYYRFALVMYAAGIFRTIDNTEWRREARQVRRRMVYV